MAPREANNPFPDQYLSLEYDGSAPIIQHDPVPVATGGDVDDQSFDHHAAAAAAVAGTIGDIDMNLNTTDDTNQNPASPMSTRSTRNRSQSHHQPPVDPLSIDPTENDPNVMMQFGALAGVRTELFGNSSENANDGDQGPSATNQTPAVTPSPRSRRLGRVIMSMSNSEGTQPDATSTLSRPSVTPTLSTPSTLSIPMNRSSMSASTNDINSSPSNTIPNSYSNGNIHTVESLDFLTASEGSTSHGNNTRPFLRGPPRRSNGNSRYQGSVLDRSLSDDEDDDANSSSAGLLPDLSLSNISVANLEVTTPGGISRSSSNTAPEQDELSSASSSSNSSGNVVGTSNPTTQQGIAAFLTSKSSEDEGFTSVHSTNSDNLNGFSDAGQNGNNLSLTFHSSTTVSDLKYFAERGCIVPLLFALNTPRLKTLGCRMLADYAKMPLRRVAVASNKRILSFLLHCMSTPNPSTPDWMGREYAVETIRSLTATEESDVYLMSCPGILRTLAQCARGGPFCQSLPLSSPRGRLHACIAIMNLSCGKSNKLEIAKCREVLETMRDVMLLKVDNSDSRHASEARLKATTCIKNLSNADANDGALLNCPRLVEALGKVAETTCHSPHSNDITTTTNACLALMNLSISKANKHVVFQTPGVMDALMAVISTDTPNLEAKIKACSALSNLAIGYDNKIPMFQYPNFVESILNVIKTDIGGEARTKACSILWSFAAEMKNQVPVVQRGDILPVLVQVAEEDTTTEARFKCVAALTLLAESLENAIPLLQSGALAPLMDILHEAGPDPTQWKGQTASWCVGFLMNLSQSDEAVPHLREAGVVELLTPLLTLNHYQSLKAAMAVTFVCRYDEDDTTYDLLRKTETVIPKIISLLHNTLAGRGGNGYKYGVFTLRSSVGCIASLASGPDFMKERIATGPVFESLLQVLTDFCVEGGSAGAIVGGGRDDIISASLAMQALHSLTRHLIPVSGPGKTSLPFESSMEEKLIIALSAFEVSPHPDLIIKDKNLALDTKTMIVGYDIHTSTTEEVMDNGPQEPTTTASALHASTAAALNCCGFPISVADFGDPTGLIANHGFSKTKTSNCTGFESDVVPMEEDTPDNITIGNEAQTPVRTFLLSDSRGRRFAVPINPSGGRRFNDNRPWCYRRGRFCLIGESPDPNFQWTRDLQRAYIAALKKHSSANSSYSDTSLSPANTTSSNGSNK